MLAEKQEIWTVSGGEADDGATYEASSYSEEPFGENYAFIGTQRIESALVYGGRQWRAESTLGVKRQLDDQGRVVSALQAGIVWRNDLFECSEFGGEIRYLTGISYAGGGFLNGEAAWRSHGDDCSGARVDLTAGYRPRENWLTLGQVFADAPKGGEDSLKLQFSAVWFSPEGRGVQFGLRAPVAGYEGPLMLILGVWD